jgi:hypothetical protein
MEDAVIWDVGLVGSNVRQERIASVFRVGSISELGTTIAVTMIWKTFRKICVVS